MPIYSLGVYNYLNLQKSLYFTIILLYRLPFSRLNNYLIFSNNFFPWNFLTTITFFPDFQGRFYMYLIYSDYIRDNDCLYTRCSYALDWISNYYPHVKSRRFVNCDVTNFPYMDINWQLISIYGDFVTSLTAYYSRTDISYAFDWISNYIYLKPKCIKAS